jgi:hypothetical protein
MSNKKEHPLYTRWASMLIRCYNPSHAAYKNYGGRGITVCDRWRGPDGFKHFYEDMGMPPKGFTLDRGDNNGDYTPSNCKWVTRGHQRLNSRPATPKENWLTQKVKAVGLGYEAVKSRVRRGWPLEKALSIPVRPILR